MWDTSIGGLLFSDQFLQIAAFLPSDHIYGLGENLHKTLKHTFTEYKTFGMFARGDPPNSIMELGETQNLYGKVFLYPIQ